MVAIVDAHAMPGGGPVVSRVLYYGYYYYYIYTSTTTTTTGTITIIYIYFYYYYYYGYYYYCGYSERVEKGSAVLVGERQRDRETERQRDRETERQRDRETERQRDRGGHYLSVSTPSLLEKIMARLCFGAVRVAFPLVRSAIRKHHIIQSYDVFS
jgi:hypothetical protein